MHDDMWSYPDAAQPGANVLVTSADVTGYAVEALDGGIGKVDEATLGTGKSYIVVDTGPWIFGKKVMLPAGVVRAVDETDEVVFVSRTKEEIKNAPDFDEASLESDSYHAAVGSYYGAGGAGYRDRNDDV